MNPHESRNGFDQMSGAVLVVASESLQLFALAPRSGERVRERGPALLQRRSPLSAAFGRRPLPAFAGRGADLHRRGTITFVGIPQGTGRGVRLFIVALAC